MVGDRPAEWIAINVRHARAVLADGEREATALFEEALGSDIDRWPLWRGRLLLVQGRWLRRHRRVAESRDVLRAARDCFDALGSAPWGEQARGDVARVRGAQSAPRARGAR